MTPRRVGGSANATVGQIGHGAQGVGHACSACDVVPRDTQHLATPPLAQQMLRVGRGGRRGGAPFVFVIGNARQRRVLVSPKPCQRLHILNQGRADEFAAGDDARQFIAQGLRQAGVSAGQCRQRAGALPPSGYRLMQRVRNHRDRGIGQRHQTRAMMHNRGNGSKTLPSVIAG